MRQIDPKSLRYLKLTTKDIRLSKVAKRDRAQPCSEEFDSYLAALEAFGESKIPPAVLRNLGDCMDATAGGAQKSTLMYHLSRFVKR